MSGWGLECPHSDGQCSGTLQTKSVVCGRSICSNHHQNAFRPGPQTIISLTLAVTFVNTKLLMNTVQVPHTPPIIRIATAS